MSQILKLLEWYDILDMAIIYYLVYRMLLFIRGTRSIQMAMGIGVFIIAFAISYFLKLYTLHWILSNFFNVFIIVIIIVFAEDIRRALTTVGKNAFFGSLSSLEGSQIIDEIVKASLTLANDKVGALIVVERSTGLKNYIERGTIIDSTVRGDLILSIFTSKDSPIHDGAIIIQDGRLMAAGSFLPLSLRTDIPKELGTRHRAALGITEETDAFVVVVSEEKGYISAVMGGKMIKNIDSSDLRKLLVAVFSSNAPNDLNLYEVFESLKEKKGKV